MFEPLTTHEVCEELGLSEPALRHVLRRPGAPRPRLHPSARVFLWTAGDVDRLRQYLGGERAPGGAAARRPAVLPETPRQHLGNLISQRDGRHKELMGPGEDDGPGEGA